MEMHTQQSLYEVHGISAPPRNRSSSRWKVWGFAILSELKLALKAELQARRAAAELTQMDDRMLRDMGISRSEIESAVRRHARCELWDATQRQSAQFRDS